MDCPPLPEEVPTAALAAFTPRAGFGFRDIPINGETEARQHRSYLRADLAAVIQRAAMESRCRSQSWPQSNDAPLILGDMSLADGSTPSLPSGQLAHPVGSHTNGNDVDVAYFQTRFFPDNDFRPVCPHWEGGEDVHHCTDTPYGLDVRRTALFTGLLAKWPGLRCIGVDGEIASMLLTEQRRLVADGLLSAAPDRFCYEQSDTGRGWFYNHHEHMHLTAW